MIKSLILRSLIWLELSLLVLTVHVLCQIWVLCPIRSIIIFKALGFTYRLEHLLDSIVLTTDISLVIRRELIANWRLQHEFIHRLSRLEQMWSHRGWHGLLMLLNSDLLILHRRGCPTSSIHDPAHYEILTPRLACAQVVLLLRDWASVVLLLRVSCSQFEGAKLCRLPSHAWLS